MLRKERKRKQIDDIIRDNVCEVYEKISATYRRGRAWRTIIDRIPRISSSSLILDAGCGSGIHSLHIAKKVAYVIALDISYSMLAHLVRRANKLFLSESIDCLTGDMRFLPFRNSVFSHVMSIASIHHIPLREERERVINEFSRVLRTKGVLFISVWNLFQPKQFLLALKTWLTGKYFEFGDAYVPWISKGKKLMRFYHLFTSKELRKLILSCNNFKILRIYRWNPKRSFFTRNFVAEAVKNE